MSGILPLCDAFLQIEMSSPELGAMLKTFGEYMPRAPSTIPMMALLTMAILTLLTRRVHAAAAPRRRAGGCRMLGEATGARAGGATARAGGGAMLAMAMRLCRAV